MCVPLSACTTFYDGQVSPGRIQRNDLTNGLAAIKDTCKALKNCSAEGLEIIGHGAGSYRHYPMDINDDGHVRGNKWSGKCASRARNINDLMDLAFSSRDVTSLEIDVQTPGSDHLLCRNGNDCLFVMHNKPDWNAIDSLDHPAVEYLQRNTVNATLAHFIANKYYGDRRLYLEIKSTRGCNAPDRTAAECRTLGARVAGEIAGAVREVHPRQADKDRQWLTVVSFSATALQSVHDGLPADLRDSIDYALIAGVHPFSLKWFLGQLKGPVPLFNDELQNFAATTPWLDRIWFSPQGIKDFNAFFHGLNEARAKACSDRGAKCRPLSYSVATYPYKQKAFAEKMTRPLFEQELASMMIDIDDVEDCAKWTASSRNDEIDAINTRSAEHHR